MSAPEIQSLLESVGAVVTNDHFVYHSGLHGRDYVRKRALLRSPEAVHRIGSALASYAPAVDFDVVVGAPPGGMLLAQQVAAEHSLPGQEVLASFAEPEETIIVSPEERGAVILPVASYNRKPGDVVLVRHPRYVLKYEAAETVRNKNVLVVADTVTSGKTLREVINAVRREGGIVIGALCVWNRGCLTEDDLGVEYFASLIEKPSERYPEDSCPLCEQGMPVNTEIGYGKAFLDRQRRQQEAVQAF